MLTTHETTDRHRSFERDGRCIRDRLVGEFDCVAAADEAARALPREFSLDVRRLTYADSSSVHAVLRLRHE